MKQIWKERLARLRTPAVLAAAALCGWGLAAFAELGEGFEAAILLLARLALIAAIGWAVTTLVDLVFKRRMRKLDLGAADNLDARTRATRLDVLRRPWRAQS